MLVNCENTSTLRPSASKESSSSINSASLADGGVARQRLMTMGETTDGFEIARRDLDIRGPGEFLGARQSGPAMLRFADLETDQWLVDQARDVAHDLLHATSPASAATVEAHLARWLGNKEEFLKV